MSIFRLTLGTRKSTSIKINEESSSHIYQDKRKLFTIIIYHSFVFPYNGYASILLSYQIYFYISSKFLYSILYIL